jgi:membrane protease YdiL (CAAX protease family)
MGALAIGVPSVVLLLSRELRVEPAPPGSWGVTALQAALLLVPAALTEELLLRGYIFAVLRETVGWRWTLIGTSIVFGLLHLRNPGADAEAIVLVIIAGFFLGAIVIVTESLYAAWMAHFAWNWVMAGALHTAVSGLGLATPNYRVVDAGPDWLTGGAWGPEGGVAAGLGMFAFLFYLFGRHLGRLER